MSSGSLLSAVMPKVCPTCGVRYPVEFKVCPRDAVELTEAVQDEEEDPLVGQTLGAAYTITRVLGEGGMGRVYEARHTRIQTKRFAIKMLHPEFSRQPEVLARFQREAEAAASIKSPYVVDVYDVDRSADGRPYLVCELLDGKELGDWIAERGRLSAPLAVRVVRQICKALSVAHSMGVVHRDMKPENVFLTGDPARPVAKVIDFGISKHGDKPGTALTKTGMIMGTPSYMAPEQARGEKVDHRVDVYAVGAILYASLTGSRPFDHADPTVTLTMVLTRDPPRPRSIEPSIPEALEMIVQRAMAKDPRERYASMEELDRDLAPFEAIDLVVGRTSQGSMTSLAPPRGETMTEARVALARPMIVLLLSLAGSMSVGLVLTAITAIMRAMRGGGAKANLTGSEAVFLLVGVTFTLATPGALLVRWLRRDVWGNTAQAVALAEKLRPPVIGALVAYGSASLFVRVVEMVFVRRGVGVAWAAWDLLFFFVTIAAAVGGAALGRLQRR
jgi:serine/threonine-protein kinase